MCPPSKKILHAADEDHHKNLQLLRMQRMADHGVSGTSGYIYNTTPIPKVQGSLGKRARKDCKSQRSTVCWETVFLSVIRSYTHEVLPTWLLEPELDKATTKGMLMWVWVNLLSPKPYTKDNRQLRNADSRKSSLLQDKEHPFVIQC